MKGKKGITLPLETIAKMILLLSVFIILGLVVQKFIWAGQGAGDYNKCKWSVYAAAKSKWAGQSAVNLDCPREEFIIEEERVVTGDTLDHELVKKEFFSTMMSCWDKMGKGELAAFDEAMLDPELKDGFACVICSSVEFEDKVQRKYSSTPVIPGFKEFLSTPYDATQTHYDLISRPEEIDVRIGPFWYETQQVGEPEYFDEIELGKKYYIIYAAFPGAVASDIFNFLNEKVSGLFKANEPYSKLVVISEDNLNNLNCKHGVYN